MGIGSALRTMFSLESLHELELSPSADIETQVALVTRSAQQAQRIWRPATITDALGVPAIQRAITLIAGTVGSLTMQGWRNGELMAETPRLLARPNPYETPRDFYFQGAWNLASRGETVFWIASRDVDGIPAALVVVPLPELTIEDNLANRLFPRYVWQGRDGYTHVGTRYSPANLTGQFVHVWYAKEPGELRGKGPLQMAGAAVSVAVEAQQWAANFYADGGNGGTLIKKADYLGEGADGTLEAETLRAQWVGKPNNIPRVIDASIDSVTSLDVNPQGAQMLQAREYQNGDAARLFGIPGALLEFAQSGTSLTYQNVESVWTNFLRGGFHQMYLEPIEQALSDLLPRSTAGRFNVDGLLRTDAKTRAEIYNILITAQVMTVDEARQAEGLAPGNVEYAAVLPSPPGSVPSHLSRIGQPETVRCSQCGRLLAELASPPYRFRCTRSDCKAITDAA